MNARKTGEVYTPTNIVDNILDFVEYNSNYILKKHIIDNSCGKGAFLLRIVERYIDVANKKNLTELELINDLETYIHGIEINEKSYLETLNNLDYLVKKKGITNNINWDILNADTLEVDKYNRKMDFVVGNPPYIRVHDLNFDYKKFEFSKKGMTDLYIIFFELGINMLSENGKLAYITPRSFTTSITGRFLRQYIIENNLLEKIIDFEHENPFESISTYPIITVLNKNKKDSNLEVYDSCLRKKFSIKNNNFYLEHKFFFADSEDIKFLRKIFKHKNFESDIYVRNGLATNADWFFYNKNYEGKLIIKAIKASTGSEISLFFPYKSSSKILDIDEIKKKNINIYDELISNESSLKNRALERNNKWYGFGRTQAINDINKDKIAISTIIKDVDSIKINYAPSGVAVYAGLYVYSPTKNLDDVKKEILSKDFVKYVSLLNNIKRGEYYNFTSRDLSIFLNYAFSKKKEV